ncbi:MAG: aminotransferase class I/II-fold pyridoxal phosphate-dependent enzyme, partial [Ilumatobacter sp.]|nr:aminotransferase class I/II-fold pyridoxal phosphate-dependent enzyme [Ilumatobacter sp.]
NSYFAGMRAGLQATRDRLVEALDSVGFITYTPEASYFVTADIRPLDPAGSGVDFCRQLPHRCGVVAIPNEVFYARPENGRHMVRFAFCKQMHVIEAAAKALTKGFST